MTNPFAGWSLGDAARDLGAAVLLLTSLALPWDLGGQGLNDVNDRWWVVVAVIVSLLSIAVPYLGTAGVLPGFNPAYSRLVKLVGFTPILVSALAAAADELVHFTDLDRGGFGTGVAMTLAGGVLALTHREYDDDPTGQLDGLWWLAARALIGAGAGLMVLTWAVEVVRMVIANDGQFARGNLAALVLLSAVSVLFPLVIPAAGMLVSGARAWSRLLVTGSFCYLFAAVAGDRAEPGSIFMSSVVEKISRSYEDLFSGGLVFGSPLPQGTGGFLVVSGAMLLLSRPWQRRPRLVHPATEWVRTAGTASVAAGLGALLFAVSIVIGVVTSNGDTAGTTIALIVLSAVIGVVALMCAVFLQGSPQGARTATSAGAALWLVLGFAVMVVVGNSDPSDSIPLTGSTTFLFLGAPILVILALTVPTSIREIFGPIIDPHKLAAAQQQRARQAQPSAPDEQPLAPPPGLAPPTLADDPDRGRDSDDPR